MASYREGYTISAPTMEEYTGKKIPTAKTDAPELSDYNASALPTGTTSAPRLDSYTAKELPTYRAQEDKVNQTYDAKQASTLAALETAYNQNMMDANAALEKIPATYRAQKNNAEVEYEKQRKAFAEYAANSGASSGAGSQAQLAYSNQLQSDLNDIGVAQANATADAQLQISKLKQGYQDSVAEAVKENDYERAAALLAEYQKQAQSVVDVAQAQADENYRAYQSQLANQQYLAEWERNQNQTEYERAQAQADENYRAYQSQLANQQYLAEWERAANEAAYQQALAQADEDYRAYQSRLSIAQYLAEWERTGDATAYQRALTEAETMAAYGDFSGYLDLGYTQSQVDTMQAYWDAANTPSYSYSGGTPSYSYSGGTPEDSDSSGTTVKRNYKEAYNAKQTHSSKKISASVPSSYAAKDAQVKDRL